MSSWARVIEGDAVLPREESDELLVVDVVQPDEDRADLLGEPF